MAWEAARDAARIADHPIDPIFLNRWSPRAFTEEQIPESDLLSILEAARWAPSAFNAQPWLFIYSRRQDVDWKERLSLLSEYNRSWALRASALVFIASNTLVRTGPDADPTPSRTHSFDTGAAWGFLALQASLIGWSAHAVAGFDVEQAQTALELPETIRLEAVAIIGRRGPREVLPEKLQVRERPNQRRPLSEFAYSGAYRSDQDKI